MSGIKIERTVTISGRWESSRSIVNEFTLADLIRLVADCEAVELPGETVLQYRSGGMNGLGATDKAALVLPEIRKER